MKNINVNQTIRALSITLRFATIVATASLLARICWWAMNPLGYDTVDSIANSYVKPDIVAQDITNRAPFGVVTVEKAPVPTIADKLKVVGVYAAGPKNSIAFIQIDGKNSIAAIGESVMDATVKAINSDGIVLVEKGQSVTINISSASGNNANTPGTSTNGREPSTSTANSYIPQTNSANNNQSSPSAQNTSPSASTPPAAGQDDDSIADKRRKMIEAFQKQNSTNGD
jgi:type II secretory pathway component PulC